MSDISNLGKKAEGKIREWLDRPEEGYCFDRLNDQMTGFYGSTNICDFTLFKAPNFYYIESKATYNDNFPFNMLTPYQHDQMLEKSKITGVKCYVIVLFASYQRAFVLDIRDMEEQVQSGGPKSLNIKKIEKWTLPFIEIKTIPSRKQLLDYDKSQVIF